MKLVVDENIPFAEESFGQHADITFRSGRSITQSDVRDADALIVRSVTRVDEALLNKSNVRFVGSCTIGEDHLNTDDLASLNIAYSSAPGSNAQSAAEYTFTALLVLADKHQMPLNKLTVAIIGGGNVGSRVFHLLNTIGIKTVVCDPYQQNIEQATYVDWQTALNADVLTFHTPLTKTGPHPTHHLLHADSLKQLPKHTAIINTSRGDVIDEIALMTDLKNNPRPLVLDVWANEPNINKALLAQCTIGTPHIAGYSTDGKVAGTQRIYNAFCQHFDIKPQWPDITLPLPAPKTTSPTTWLEAAISAYNIHKDDQSLRNALINNSLQSPQNGFDNLRKHYPIRREFSAYSLDATTILPADQIKEIGFKINEVNKP